MGFKVAARRVVGEGGYQVQHLSGGTSPAAPTYAQTIMATPGLIAYWRMDETSGTTANDEVGAADGTYQGGFTLGAPSLLTSDPGTAVTLNGTTGRILFGAGVLPEVAGGAVTFEGWIKTADTAQADQHLVAAYANSGGFEGWGVMYSLGGSQKVGYYSSTHAAWVESTGTIANTVKHHVVVTCSAGGAVTFYIDGAAAGTASSAAPGTYTGQKAFGSSMDTISPVSLFEGTFDEFALYSGVLSAGQVGAHHAAGIA